MASEMTPTQAAEVLRELGDYEERLSWRAGGMTLMVWAMAAASIFLAYGAADPYFADIGMPWLYAVLWIPSVAAGIIATSSIWRAHAVSLGQEEQAEARHSILGVVAFFAVAGLVFAGLDVGIGLEWPTAVFMTITNGLFAFGVVHMERRVWGHTNTATLGAATAMLLGGVALGVLGVPLQASSLAGAFLTGIAWFTAGILTYRRG